jgi:hypothetical protein
MLVESTYRMNAVHYRSSPMDSRQRVCGVVMGKCNCECYEASFRSYYIVMYFVGAANVHTGQPTSDDLYLNTICASSCAWTTSYIAIRCAMEDTKDDTTSDEEDLCRKPIRSAWCRRRTKEHKYVINMCVLTDGGFEGLKHYRQEGATTLCQLHSIGNSVKQKMRRV